MPDTYKIIFIDKTEIVVKDPDIDEDNRLVKVEKKTDGEETIYDYYPFESIKMIVFVG